MSGERADDVAAIVLAGGKSERFGSDKASALLQGRPLLEWVVASVGSVCGEVVVVRAEGQEIAGLTAERAVRVVEDRHMAKGPLAGMIAGFEATERGYCLVATCDAPLVAAGVVRVMTERIGDADVALPMVQGRAQPLLALYRREAALPALLSAMERDVLSVNVAIGDLRTVRLGAEDFADADPGMLSFRNCNTREELAELEAILAQ